MCTRKYFGRFMQPRPGPPEKEEEGCVVVVVPRGPGN